MLVHCDTVKVASYVVPYPLEASTGYQGYYGRSCYKNGHVNSSLWGRSLYEIGKVVPSGRCSHNVSEL